MLRPLRYQGWRSLLAIRWGLEEQIVKSNGAFPLLKKSDRDVGWLRWVNGNNLVIVGKGCLGKVGTTSSRSKG